MRGTNITRNQNEKKKWLTHKEKQTIFSWSIPKKVWKKQTSTKWNVQLCAGLMCFFYQFNQHEHLLLNVTANTWTLLFIINSSVGFQSERFSNFNLRSELSIAQSLLHALNDRLEFQFRRIKFLLSIIVPNGRIFTSKTTWKSVQIGTRHYIENWTSWMDFLRSTFENLCFECGWKKVKKKKSCV